MGVLGDIWEVGSELGMIGIEATEAAAEATPFIGAAFNGAKATAHATQAHDAELAGDTESAKFYGSEAAYDWTKAIPGVGTALGIGELAEGAVGGIAALGYGGGIKDVGRGFVRGMDNFKDTAMDLGAMAGIDEFGAARYDGDPKALAGLGAHTKAREHAEEQDPALQARVAQAQRAQRAAGR